MGAGSLRCPVNPSPAFKASISSPFTPSTILSNSRSRRSSGMDANRTGQQDVEGTVEILSGRLQMSRPIVGSPLAYSSSTRLTRSGTRSGFGESVCWTLGCGAGVAGSERVGARASEGGTAPPCLVSSVLQAAVMNDCSNNGKQKIPEILHVPRSWRPWRSRIAGCGKTRRASSEALSDADTPRPFCKN